MPTKKTARKIGNKKGENPTDSLDNIRHSLAHLLAMAVLKKFPTAKLGIGPVIENGFYYDFVLPKPLSQEDLPALENTMREAIKNSLPFKGQKITLAEAKKMFKAQPYKIELTTELAKDKKLARPGHPGGAMTAYHTGDPQKGGFTDLCRGGHVKNTKEIPADGFKLDKISGAYWQGNTNREQMTRIYGLAFASKTALDEYSNMRVEAEKRDHKKLGVSLDLFTFSDLVGAGLPMWTPKGTMLRDLLDAFVWDLRRAKGYDRVDIPHIAKKDLYETSGHWDKFKDELFKIETRENHLFVMKPMNCPHHAQIYARKKWSYRELPQRYASTTKVYRDEQSGELAGLSRVRSITQDDAHVFCRKSQVKNEINAIWDIVNSFYSVFGFKLKVRLSLRDQKNPQNYLGTPKLWNEAEAEIRAIAVAHKADFFEGVGEAAFYGPKVDFITKDSIGREWQVATIQLDMNLPERFDLSCVNEKGENERIVMLHAAIMGSIERFASVLIEHYAGAFPVWLSPEQVRIIPVSDKFGKYSAKVLSALKEAGIRVSVDDSSETLGKRIRDAKIMKTPYILVVGEKEESAQSVAVNTREKDEGMVELDKFVERIKKEVEGRK